MKIADRYKGKWTLSFSFSLGYAILVVLLTSMFRFFPAAIALENQFFDRIQKSTVIDSSDDFLYERYSKQLNELFLVNLDSSFFDFETNRISKTHLTELLRKFQPYAKETEAIFLDYSYSYTSKEDSLLNAALRPFEDKLCLPFNFELNKDLSIGGPGSSITKSDLEIVRVPVYPFSNLGYAVPFEDPYTNTNRYFKYHFDDKSYASAPWKMYQRSRYAKENKLDIDPVKMNEIQFILRNKEPTGEEKAVLVYDAKDIVNGTMDTIYLKKAMQNKVVIVGLFDDYKTKYLNPIDKFITPVDSRMSGALLMTNAFLNLSANIHIKRGSWKILFLLNFFVALGVAMNYGSELNSRYIAIIIMVINLFISLLLFYYISYFFYIFYQIKLALGMSLLIYQKKYYLFSWYRHWWNTKYSKS